LSGHQCKFSYPYRSLLYDDIKGVRSGLGLSVSFMIVDSIGGKIEAENSNGKGAVLSVVLPLANERSKLPPTLSVAF